MNEADKYAFEQIKQQYSMPFLQIGMNAIVNKNAVKVIGVSSGGLKGKLVNYNKIVHFTQLGKLLTITKSGNLLKIIGQNKYEQKRNHTSH